MKTKLKIRLLVGLLICILGVVAGLYVGLIWGWIGGVSYIIESIKAGIPNSVGFAGSILRVLLAGNAGIFVGCIMIYAGARFGLGKERD